MKINFFDLCFFDVSNVEKDSFVLESLSFIEDKRVLLFVDGLQVVFPYTFSLVKSYNLSFVQINSSFEQLGLFDTITKNDFLLFDDKKHYAVETIFDLKTFVEFKQDDLFTCVYNDQALFYKFFVPEKIATDFSVFDMFDVPVSDFKVNGNGFVYFNPKNNYNYYYLNDGRKQNIFYSKAFENKIDSFRFSDNVLSFETGQYMTYLCFVCNTELDDFFLKITLIDGTVLTKTCKNNLFVDFSKKENCVEVFGNVSKIEVFSKNTPSAVFSKLVKTCYFLLEQTFFIKDGVSFFKKNKIDDPVFFAKEYGPIDFEQALSLDFTLCDLSKKYLFKNGVFVESEYGNFSFDSENSAHQLCSSYFEFEESQCSVNKTFLEYPAKIDHSYYSFNFKPVFTNLEQIEGE